MTPMMKLALALILTTGVAAGVTVVVIKAPDEPSTSTDWDESEFESRPIKDGDRRGF
ncbi:hypothetical protein GCM10007923_63910 [Shinella yambaruensis]|uniref:Uncharacterized protein n=1 Tax=Shinella yambaruensis TaxID=415996 RepID=A0ABQ5ZQK8_9HYPH|nr:hypothetical protein GCM10007923_63910 [Shinella yambaruensis]